MRVLDNVHGAFKAEDALLEAPRGNVGEMCAAALLGFAIDSMRKTAKHVYLSEAVPLKDFLRVLGL